MSGQAIKILLIEDNPGDARLVHEMLVDAIVDRFDLIHVTRLDEGLFRINEKSFDVVLLDLSLPDAQGLDTLSQVQSMAPSLPIVILSGLNDEARAVQAVQKGAQDYLVKGHGDGHLLVRSIRYAIERKLEEGLLQKSKSQLAEAQRLARVGSWQWDIPSDKVTWSDELYRIFGIHEKEIEVTSDTYLQHVHPKDKKYLRLVIERACREQLPISHRHRIIRPDGAVRVLQITGRILVDEAGHSKGLIGSSQDITEQKKTEEALRARGRQQASVARFGQLALEGAELSDLIDNVVSLVTDTLEVDYSKVLELRPDEKSLLLRAGIGWKDGLVGSLTIETGHNSQSGYTLISGQPVVVEDFETEIRFKPSALFIDHKVLSGMSVIIQGERRPFGVLGAYSRRKKVFNEDDLHFLQAMAHMLAIAIARRRTEKMIEHQAYHDVLTGLPNRFLFEDHLSKSLAQARRSPRRIGIMFIDLDRFKAVNDSLGHASGDELLQVVAQRLLSSVRESDTVARMGGDEFSVLLSEIESVDSVTEVAERIIEELQPPIKLGRYRLHIGASIGIALYPQGGRDAQTLLRNAGTALYRAKGEGKNTFRFYSPTMRKKACDCLETEFELRQALERGEFQLYFQPQVEIKTHKIIGFEALIRWKRPKVGLVLPADFVPLAEDVGLLLPIGEWVLRAACRQNKTWEKEGLPATKIGVNLSPCQFQKGNLAAMVKQVLKETDLDPRLLELEITERLLMRNEEPHIAALHELTALGVQLTIDDFGTGYSSLSYLKRLPLGRLKIDRTFVRDITTDPSNAVIAKTVVGMAHSLQLKALAEGVETTAQLTLLGSYGCDEIQGFLVSRPLPADEAARLLTQGMNGVL
ncbi:MAG: EAL domain-containing protein [Nitrospiria bacterium]